MNYQLIGALSFFIFSAVVCCILVLRREDMVRTQLTHHPLTAKKIRKLWWGAQALKIGIIGITICAVIVTIGTIAAWVANAPKQMILTHGSIITWGIVILTFGGYSHLSTLIHFGNEFLKREEGSQKR